MISTSTIHFISLWDSAGRTVSPSLGAVDTVEDTKVMCSVLFLGIGDFNKFTLYNYFSCWHGDLFMPEFDIFWLIIHYFRLKIEIRIKWVIFFQPGIRE